MTKLMSRTRWKKHFQLLYLVVSVNLIFFLLIYHRLVLITSFDRLSLSTFVDEREFPSSAVCHVPQFDPWDQTIGKSLRIKPVYRCPTQKRVLIDRLNGTQLLINQHVNRTFYAGRVTHCFRMNIQRNPEEKLFRDWSYSLTEMKLMDHNPTEPILDADFVLVRCYNDRRGFFLGEKLCSPLPCAQVNSTLVKQSLVYEYVHPLMRRKKAATSSPLPSVLLIVLDAVSHLQAQRALPRTLKYLKSKGLITFDRHAVVGDGTFANLVPTLFGRPASELEVPNTNDSRYVFQTLDVEIDNRTKKKIEKKRTVFYPGPFDNFSFILQNFSRVNYTTFFSEEWRESAFYNLKNGFRRSPTDFYLRPYWLAVYDSQSYPTNVGNSNPKPCYLDKLLHRLSFDWLKDFLQAHQPRDVSPVFGVLKVNEMSHDYLERLFWIDEDLLKFFRELVEEDLLKNTIVIFAGDHGHRQHRIRLTRIGSFEVKLPFLSVLLPESFARRSPQALANLRANRLKLTSWWDVYETFAHLLRMVEEAKSVDPLAVRWKATSAGISLFQPIPERNCSAAGVPDEFCPCSRSKPTEVNSSLIRDFALATIEHINKVKLGNHSHLCAPLELKALIRAEKEEIFPNDRSLNWTSRRRTPTFIYTILFEVSPSNGLFESRLLYDPSARKVQLHQDILRINLYGQSSQCIRDQYQLRSFCYCRSFASNATKNSPSTAGN